MKYPISGCQQMCKCHYKKWKKDHFTEAEESSHQSSSDKSQAAHSCIVDECQKYLASGCMHMCRRHFNEWKKTHISEEGKTDVPEQQEQELGKLDAAPKSLQCVAVGCCRYIIAGCRQMCKCHYKRWKRDHVTEADDDNEAEESSHQNSSDKGQAAPSHRQCIAPGCQKYLASGCMHMCRRHFNEWKKTQVSDEWKVYEHQNNKQELNKLDAAPESLRCVAVGCCRYMIVGCRQMCAHHYKKWKKNHEADDDDNVGADESSQQSSSDKGQAAPSRRQCIVEGCQKYLASGCMHMCRRHFNEWKKHNTDEGKTDEPENNEQELDKLDAAPESLQCAAVGCSKYPISGCKKMCNCHYKKWKKDHSEGEDDNGAEESSQQSSSSKGKDAPSHRQCVVDGCHKYFVAGYYHMCSQHFAERAKKNPSGEIEVKKKKRSCGRSASREPEIKQPRSGRSGTAPANRQCMVEGCSKYYVQRSNGMCSRHFRQRYVDGVDLDLPQPKTAKHGKRAIPSRRRCVAAKCMKYQLGSSWHHLCSAHFQERSEKQAIIGDGVQLGSVYEDEISNSSGDKHSPKLSNLTTRRQCKVPGCERYHRGVATSLMCAKHFKESLQLRDGDLEHTTSARPAPESRQCVVEGCMRYKRHKEYCAKHFNEHHRMTITEADEDESSNDPSSMSNAVVASRKKLVSSLTTVEKRRCKVSECLRYHRGKKTHYMCRTHFIEGGEENSTSEQSNETIT
jgi:hypothetical protein